MKIWSKILIVLCFYWPVHAATESAQPKWKIDIRERYQFQAFDRTINFRWTLHQGLLFISPERILVYQVNRSRGPAKLAARDASGGSGNFILEIRVLNAADGSEIKSLNLTTNADFSKVIATHDGKFIVRTGDIVYLYSADFQRLASRSLPLKRQTAEEGWQIGVSPSGEEVALVHQQIFKRNALSPTSAVEKAEADVEILNADTLQLTKSFVVPAFLAGWYAADHFLLSSSPTPTRTTFGLLDFSGYWSPFIPDWYSSRELCAYQAAALERRLFAAFGCGELSVFFRSGEKVFSLKTGSKEFVGSVMGAGEYLAVQLERHWIDRESSANVPIAMAQPLRVDLYDFKSKNSKPLLSVGLHNGNAYYAVSPRGDLAVGDGTSVAVFAASH